ncbi:MAG TPA: cytochrome C [bacterium]|nr:cytochrome C [bacterium]
MLVVAYPAVRPADALPSFSGQTGAPCSACHVGGFGPQLTPFGISFRANGYTLAGGTGPWSHIPVNLVVSPSFQTDARDQPTAPAGYGTNNFFNILGSGTSLFIAGGYSFGDNFGIGGFEQVGFLAVPGGSLVSSEATSDLAITKNLTFGDHSLLLGFDLANQPSGGDPYNTLYNGFQFPYLTPFVGPTPAASPAISALGTSVYGLSLSGLYDNSIFAEVGLYQTWSANLLSSMNIAAPSLGTISGGAPYFRLADQHTWGNNFFEVGGVWMNIPLQQIPGALSPSAQNQYTDWGLDATYQRRFGPDVLAITSNILFETQNLGASFAAGLSSNASNSLTQFRLAASYYWHDTYGLTLAYSGISGSNDSTLFAPAPMTGSASGSPNSQAIIAQIDWTPFGSDNEHAGFPWLNVRVGLQYTYYLQFNGGTTNYDGNGRNASDNNTLLLFTWWAF